MRLKTGVIALLLSGAGFATHAAENALTYYCAQPDSNLQYSVEMGEVKRVHTREGPFMMVNDQSDLTLAKDYLRKELDKIDLPNSCKEYLLSQAGFSTYETGELIARVYFSFDQSKLTKESVYILDKLKSDLQSSSSDLLLEGHTDSVGSKKYNMQLGLNRAKAVEAHMLELGAQQSTLITSSQGEAVPIANNSSAEGRAQNRRVDVTKAN